MKLNLGHTIGHGVEAKSHFTISHGQAVAIGTAIVCRSAAAQGLLGPADCQRILHLLEQFGLPVSTPYTAEELYRYALSDKKRSGGTVNLIVPREIGRCDIVPTPTQTLPSFIQAGL